MGLEIPRIVPPGLYTDVKARERARPGRAPAGSRTQAARTAQTKANAQAGGSAPTSRPELPVNVDIREVLANLEKIISQFNRRFEFVADDTIDRIVVKVIDKQTDKVIKEIPPVEIQHLLVRLKEMMGLLVNEQI
jgi:flagellar protein FlaG